MVEDGKIPQTHLILEGTLKEKEPKVENARPFGKCTWEIRLWQTSRQKNLADGPMRYFEEQSMTLSELQRTLISLTTVEVVAMRFDFKRWCLHFGPQLMGPVLQEIDRFFGLKQVFWLAQFVPYHCLVTVNDRFCCPPVQLDGEPVEGELSIRQAKHWMEGLSQKEWTLVTQCLILVLAERTKCPSRLLGQGDNQMNLIQPPRATVNIETFSRNYLDELGRLAADGGLQLKKEETWISTILGAFSFFTPSDFVSQLSR